MKRLVKPKFAVLLAILLAVPFIGLNSGRASAQTAPPPQSENQPEEPAENEQEAAAVYSYVAQAGDSYSVIARKAIQTYGLKQKVDLSLAQIIFAETNLTQEADSPYLEVGQKIDVEEATVRKWVEAAQKLSDAQEDAWNYYVQFAEFNTDDVGQS